MSACSFSYSDTVGPPNFCWTNLQDKIYKKLGYDIWSILHIYMCEYDCLNVCTYITTDHISKPLQSPTQLRRGMDFPSLFFNGLC